MIRKLMIFTLCAIISGVTFAQSDAAVSPDAIVRQTMDDVLKEVRSDPEIQAGNAKRVSEVLDSKLLGRFDFRRMTILAMGRNWRSANADQQKTLVEQFQTLLVRTYSKALTQFRDDAIVVKPLRAESGAKDVVVRTEVQRKGEQPVAVDYSLIKGSDGQWRCYDVVVSGVSLVTNYRDDFNLRVKESGVEGLIKALSEKNAALTQSSK